MMENSENFNKPVLSEEVQKKSRKRVEGEDKNKFSERKETVMKKKKNEKKRAEDEYSVNQKVAGNSLKLKSEKPQETQNAKIKKKTRKKNKEENNEKEEQNENQEYSSSLIDQADEELSLSNNKNHAVAYEFSKNTKQIRKNKDLLEEMSSEDESSNSEEDENAKLLTKKVERKIFDTLLKIKQKDKSIYDKNKNFFSDNDFESDDEEEAKCNEKKQNKSLTYSDLMRDVLLNDGAEAFEKEEEKLNKKKYQKNLPTYFEEQKKLKEDFLSAVNNEFEQTNNRDEDDVGVVLKEKSQEEIENEEKAYQLFLKENKSKDISLDENQFMRHYWADDDNLDENERFLRDYILNKGWLEDGSKALNTSSQQDIDTTDDLHLEKVDNFEAAYNFRFEEQGGCKMEGHARKLEDSVRKKDTRRKEKRQKKKQKLKEEKTRREELLKKLKNEKKKEIIERIKKIQQVSGCNYIGVDKIDFDGDFDPEIHDKNMDELFGSKYEELPDSTSRPDLLPPPPGTEEFLDTSVLQKEELRNFSRRHLKLQRNQQSEQMHLQKSEDIAYPPIFCDDKDFSFAEHGCDRVSGNQLNDEENEINDEKNRINDEENRINDEENRINDEENENEWWMCDECQQGIAVGQKRFDCTVCENFTLCKVCVKLSSHPHKLIRKKVPVGCEPPKEAKGAAERGTKLTLDKYLDEYYQLDYEDILGGDLPTRFKYKRVKPNNYGLTVEDIFNKSEKELQAIMPLKKLAPYRDDDSDENFSKRLKIKKRVDRFLKGKKKSSKNIEERNKSTKMKKNFHMDKKEKRFQVKSKKADFVTKHLFSNNTKNKKVEKKISTKKHEVSNAPKLNKQFNTPSHIPGVSKERLNAYKLNMK